MSTYSNYLLLLHCNEVLKGFTENVGGHSGPLTPQLWWPGQHFKWPRATGPPLLIIAVYLSLAGSSTINVILRQKNREMVKNAEFCLDRSVATLNVH